MCQTRSELKKMKKLKKLKIIQDYKRESHVHVSINHRVAPSEADISQKDVEASSLAMSKCRSE